MSSTSASVRDVTATPSPPATEPPVSSSRPRRKLVIGTVGVDAVAASMVEAAAERARADGILPEDSELRHHADMPAARRAFEADGGRTILVVEATELVTRMTFPPSIHVVAIAGPDQHGTSRIGVDDVLRRPFHADDVELSLRLAARSLSRGDLLPITDQILELVRLGRSGEIIVSGGAEGARILVDAGRIAWIHRIGHPMGLGALLAAEGVDVAEDTVREVVDECRRSRRSFAAVLTEWAVVDQATLARCIATHLARELAIIATWPHARAELMEGPPSGGSSPSFEAASLLPSVAAPRPRIRTLQNQPAVGPTPLAADAGSAWLGRIAEMPDVLGCALLDTISGRCLGHHGDIDGTSSEVWSLAAAFTSLGSATGDILATTPTRAFLVRAFELAAGAVGVVKFDPRRLSPAMARLRLSEIR